jgi:hypothetical protein
MSLIECKTGRLWTGYPTESMLLGWGGSPVVNEKAPVGHLLSIIHTKVSALLLLRRLRLTCVVWTVACDVSTLTTLKTNYPIDTISVVLRLNVQCNDGHRSTNIFGDLPSYGTLWHDPHSLANILSLRRVASQYRFEFDSEAGGIFIVTKPDGTLFEYCESENGCYDLDTEKTIATVLVGTSAQK